MRCVVNGAKVPHQPSRTTNQLQSVSVSVSISISLRVWRRGNTDLGVPGVEDGVKALEERLAEDELESGDEISYFHDDEVDAVLVAAGEVGVEYAGEDLRVAGELVGAAADVEEERVEGVVLVCGDAEEARGFVVDCAGRGDVALIRVW